VAIGDFGDPLGGSDYTLCVIDRQGGSPTLRLSATAPAGGLCAGKSCWAAKSTAYKYKDKDATPDGLTSMGLGAGAVPGKGKLKVKGKSANLGVPALGLTTPVTVRLVRDDASTCWEATYSTPIASDASQFKAKSD
jgi:hypothetical protein